MCASLRLPRVVFTLVAFALLLIAFWPAAAAGQQIIAHRGASHDAPENTLAAMKEAIEQGADALEADFHLTRDGRIICIHDGRTRRVAEVDLRIAEHTFDELRQIDVGSWKGTQWAGQVMPTIDEILALVGEDMFAVLDIKAGPEILPGIKDAIDRSGLEPHQIRIIAFDADVVAASKTLMPEIQVFWLVRYREDRETGKWTPTLDSVLQTLERIEADGLSTNGNRNVVDAAFVDRVRQAGYSLHVWTINDPDEARYFQVLGFDTITTDRPGHIREHLFADDEQGHEPVVAVDSRMEGELEPFLGEPLFETQRLFDDERFPNVLITTRGTVLATWGRNNVVVRRSFDAGRTFDPPITIAPGWHGGGAIVDEVNGHILVFSESDHPPADTFVHRSTNEGRSWRAQPAIIREDEQGNESSAHMADRGITLRHGEHAGRLVRSARVYRRGGGYNTILYSDDRGRTWHSSAPFPVRGTGEGAVVELSDGRIYFSSRHNRFTNNETFDHRRLYAISEDGGATWSEWGRHDELPDGPRYRGDDRRGHNYNGHFGINAGLVRLPVAGRDILLYSANDIDSHQRRRMTVWASFDGGRTWPVKKLVDGGHAAYSSLAAGRPGTRTEGIIFLQYEGGPNGPHHGGNIARFNLTWLIEGHDINDLLPD